MRIRLITDRHFHQGHDLLNGCCINNCLTLQRKGENRSWSDIPLLENFCIVILSC